MMQKAVIIPVVALALATVLLSGFLTLSRRHMMPGDSFSIMRMDKQASVGVSDPASSYIDETTIEFQEGGAGGMMKGQPLGEDVMMKRIDPGYPMMYTPGEALQIDDRVYQKSAYVQVVVDDVSQYIKQQKEYFLSIDGRVLSSNINVSDDDQSGYLYVKVPVAKFDEVTGRITEGVKEVISENITAQDMTGEKVQTDDQVVKIQDELAQKEIDLAATTNSAEKARIELQIKRLKEQLTQAETQQGQVIQETQYAAISLSASNNERDFDPMARPGLDDQLEQAWNSLGKVGYLLAVGAVWFAVYSLIWLPIVLVVRWLIGKKNKISNDKK